jgi:predicted membrane protein
MHDIPTLDAAGLRRFGLIFAAIIACLFGLVFPFVFGFQIPWWPWVLAAFFVGWSLLKPSSLDGFYRLWMRFGLIMNAIVSRILLGAVFYLAVLPTGLILRIRHKDPMRRGFDTKADTYRISSSSAEPEQMRKPF